MICGLCGVLGADQCAKILMSSNIPALARLAKVAEENAAAYFWTAAVMPEGL